MNQSNAYKKAIGSYIPSDILSNQNLENTFNITSQWILESSKIQSKFISSTNIITLFI